MQLGKSGKFGNTVAVLPAIMLGIKLFLYLCMQSSSSTTGVSSLEVVANKGKHLRRVRKCFSAISHPANVLRRHEKELSALRTEPAYKDQVGALMCVSYP